MVARTFYAVDSEALTVTYSTSQMVGDSVINNSSSPDGTQYVFNQGFGEDAVSDTAAPAVSASKLATTKSVAPVRAVGPASNGLEDPTAQVTMAEARAPEARTPQAEAPSSVDPARDAKPHSTTKKGPGARGSVVYVALSLTETQAVGAQAWARAAQCSVSFLIRKVAQGLRDPICEDWQESGMPAVTEQRGARGKFPTSVTLTLPPGFAANLAARHDPLGLQGLGRTIGPAFRARFEDAFDKSLAAAGFGQDTEGDGE